MWDYGDMVAPDTCFAVAKMPAAQLLQSHVEEADPEHAHLHAHHCSQPVSLEPPTGNQRRRSAAQAVIGFGRAKSPGSIQVLRSEIDFTADSAMTVFKVTNPNPNPNPSPNPNPNPNPDPDPNPNPNPNVFKTFDIDAVRHEAQSQAAPVWTTLSDRYAKVRLRVRVS